MVHPHGCSSARVVAMTASLFLFTPGAWPWHHALECGDVVTGHARLTADLSCVGAGPALTLSTAATLDLHGFTVSCVGDDRGTGVLLLGRRDRLHAGAVSGCRVGVEVAGEGAHRVTFVQGSANRVWFHVMAGSVGNLLLGNTSTGGMDAFQVEGDRNHLALNTVSGGRVAFVLEGSGNEVAVNVAGPTNEAIIVSGDRNRVRANRVAGRIYGIWVNGAEVRVQHNQVEGGELLGGIMVGTAGSGARLVSNTVTGCLTGVEVRGGGAHVLANRVRHWTAGSALRAPFDDRM